MEIDSVKKNKKKLKIHIGFKTITVFYDNLFKINLLSHSNVTGSFIPSAVTDIRTVLSSVSELPVKNEIIHLN